MHYTNHRERFQTGAAGAARFGLARLALWAGVLVVGAPVIAEAQISPGAGPAGGPGMGGPTPGGGDDKKEGVAVEAPKTPGLLPTTPALPAPKSRRKKWKLLELDGYYRMRTDWFKNFNLGFPSGGYGGTPFPSALGCDADASDAPCDGSLSSANMRLRLEPTINLDEGTSVHIQADLLDNLVLGSTPELSNSTSPPIGAFGNGTQAPSVKGVNSDRDSIQIKRAWAEVALPLGVLKFGRMPNQWGMGILHNAGGADPINGGYNYDADYGDTVDRASFSLLVPGTNIRAMVASDWALTRLVSNQTSVNDAYAGHPFDLDDSDDINSWVGAISRIDSPQDFKDTVDRGELAVNWGVYFEYKTQGWDYNTTGFTVGGDTSDLVGTQYVKRGLKQYSPDLWGKIGYGAFTLEAELVAQLGTIDHLEDVTKNGAVVTTSADIRKYGGAGRLTWRALDGKLRLGAESGFASGDQTDGTNPGTINVAQIDPLSGLADGKLSRFSFNRDYQVDMILWRRLVGAVSNAGYVKPFVQYDVTKGVTFKMANITSFALRPSATPGHETMYGTEFNGDLSYTTGGLSIGLAYGVLFPLGAMNHPADITGDSPQTYGFTDASDSVNGSANVGDAGTAHTVQARFVLGF